MSAAKQPGHVWHVGHNPLRLPLDAVPAVSLEELRRVLSELGPQEQRLAALFAQMVDGDAHDLYAILADDRAHALAVLKTRIGREYPSFTEQCPQAHLFEREIHEQSGILPAGHPWLKPVRFPGSPQHRCGEMDFYQISGEETHEVAVGPVHAGVIEPGHFRFQCHGEEVLHLEISLGYQHRGIEEMLLGGPHKASLAHMEAVAGDSSIGHTLAYCQLLEACTDCEAPLPAAAMRGVALELERLANHTGDLGALANDVAYLPTASYCGRIRGDFLNMTARLCGSRLGRAWLLPGGVRFDFTGEEERKTLAGLLRQAEQDLEVAVGLLWTTPSVMMRFENTGRLSIKDCKRIGLVGPPARACGAARDVRRTHPFGCYRSTPIEAAIEVSGCVAARALVRWKEIKHSLGFLQTMLRTWPEGKSRTPAVDLPLMPDTLTVSLVEGWRGEICHAAITDGNGRFARYKIVDPSFHNWFGLALALRGRQISDFPLCNKSFNLSYCGFDL